MIKPKNELKALTGLRGLAAVYVVLYHDLRPPFSNPITTLVAHGYLAVDLFFTLSGFVMAMNYARMFASGWSTRTYAKFLGRRIARVYPLYLAATIVGFIEAVHSKPMSGSYGLALVLNIFMVQSWGLAASFDAPCWSISAEWFAYLLFPLLLIPTMFGDRRSRYIAGIFAVATLGGLCFLPNSFHGHALPAALYDLVAPDWAVPVFRCIAEFVLGLLAYGVSCSEIGASFASKRWASSSIVAALLVLLMIPRSDPFVVLLFPALIICLTSEAYLPARILSSPPFEFVGLISYSIYLSHVLLPPSQIRSIISSLPHVFGKLSPEHHATAILIVLTFPISYLAYRTIEVPGRRWLRALFEGPSTLKPHPLKGDSKAEVSVT